MSDNSMILVGKDLKGGYSVSHIDIDGGADYAHSTHKTLLLALKRAKKIQNEENPEYGVHLGEL